MHPPVEGRLAPERTPKAHVFSPQDSQLQEVEMTRVWATILGCAGVMIAADVALAAGAGQVDRPSDTGGLLREIAHKHTHLNGHALLGDKIKHDGKHALGKLSGRTVTADVKGGKVVN